MRLIKVAAKQKRIAFPRAYTSFLKSDKRFIIGRSGDTILLKQSPDSVLDAAKLIPDPNQPTMEEIVRMVHEVRRKHEKKRR